jgi:hypothetical protein
MLRLRDDVYSDPETRRRFDKVYDVATSALFSARAANQEIQRLWAEQGRKVTSGEIARVEGRAIRIDESIERDLRQQIETFLNAAVRATKQGMREVAAELVVDIGFLFKKAAAFEAGIASLQGVDAPLAEYLRHTRSWSELLVERRNAVEHFGWVLPGVRYRQTTDGIVAIEPEISGRRASEFVAFIFDRVSCFIEEFTAHGLQHLLPADITITRFEFVTEPQRRRIDSASRSNPAVCHVGELPTTRHRSKRPDLWCEALSLCSGHRWICPSASSRPGQPVKFFYTR